MSRPSRLALFAIIGLACSGAACGSCFGPPKANTVIPMDIRVYDETLPLMEQSVADDLLTKTGLIIQSKDGSADTNCPVALGRVGFGTFHIGNGVIASPWDFDDVFGGGASGPLSVAEAEPTAPGFPARVRQVRVVKEITWCGAESALFGGCSIGMRMVVTRHDPAIEGILWAHEVGHTRLLGHRTDSWLAIMHPDILNNHFELNQWECGLYSR